MLKIFGTGKKKRPNHHKLKPGDIKIPIPMVNGVQYANMTESQISTLIGGGNKGTPQMKKSASSISSQQASKIESKIPPPEQSQQQQLPPYVYTTRSISSPPVLLMPKPVHRVPPTRFILRSHEYEKTQVESSDDDNSYSESSDEDDIIELFPSNPVHKVGPTLIIDPSHQMQEEQPLIKQRIPEEREEEINDLKNVTTEGAPVTVKRGSPQDERNKNIYIQSIGSVTRTSDDSIRQYISASESPFFTTSSVSNMNNFPNNQAAAFPSSPLTTSSPITQQNFSTPKDLNTTNHHHNSFVSAKSFNSSELLDTLSTDTNNNEHSAVEVPPETNITHTMSDVPRIVARSTSPTQNSREKTPVFNNRSRAHSSSPPVINTATSTKQLKVTRPASSSASSATVGIVGHDAVTPTAQSRFTNNNDKPPGNQFSSEEPALSPNDNNNNNILQLLETTTGGHSVAISTMQKQQMSLTDDLEELKRTVDRIQQQRVSDREEHLNRVKEQKLRETEILEQINLTKQKLEMAIAGKVLYDDRHQNANATDNNAFSASSSRGNEINHLQQEQEQQQEPPVMKASTSTSSKGRSANGYKETSSSRQPRQPQNDPRSRNRKSASSSSLPRLNSNGDPYFSTESYFPDVSRTDFEYMNGLHAPPPLQNQFFQPPKFRGGAPIPNNAMRGYYPEMEFMDGYEMGFDSPRSRSSRHHHSDHPQQQQRRQRSKSVESQWRGHEYTDQPPPQFLQQPPPPQHYVGYDLVDPPMMEDYRYNAPLTPRTRSRKSSTHSARSNLSSEGGPMTRNTSDLHSGYHSAAEEEEDVGPSEAPLNNNYSGGVDPGHENNRMDGGERQQAEDHHRHTNSGKHRRGNNRPPPSNGNLNGHLSMMYHNAFGPPPPMMGMMNDNRDRNKMRPPPYGYNNMPPPGGEFYPYMHQRVSPRMLGAEQQWAGGPPPPHWGPPPPGGNYGIPPPQPDNNNPNAGANNAGNDAGNGSQNDFARRYPQQSASLQQTPQQSQHGYLPIYADGPHRLYM